MGVTALIELNLTLRSCHPWSTFIKRALPIYLIHIIFGQNIPLKLASLLKKSLANIITVENLL